MKILQIEEFEWVQKLYKIQGFSNLIYAQG